MAHKYLLQKAAQDIDKRLMSAEGGFSVDQLMELAGLSVAEAVQKSFDKGTYPNVLVCVGPGNNGGDGLVAARHLFHFGYRPTLYYPKQPDKELYQRLLRQCANLDIKVHQDGFENLMNDSTNKVHLLIDAVFGFSFHGDVREPFRNVIDIFEARQRPPLVSVDIPSGWHVENGPTDSVTFQPDVLVSLTAPKECVRHFTGKRHFLGGRFVPPSLAKEFGIHTPLWKGAEQVVEL